MLNISWSNRNRHVTNMWHCTVCRQSCDSHVTCTDQQEQRKKLDELERSLAAVEDELAQKRSDVRAGISSPLLLPPPFPSPILLTIFFLFLLHLLFSSQNLSSMTEQKEHFQSLLDQQRQVHTYTQIHPTYTYICIHTCIHSVLACIHYIHTHQSILYIIHLHTYIHAQCTCLYIYTTIQPSVIACIHTNSS